MDLPPLPTFVEFSRPGYCALLALLPILVWLGRHTLSGLGPLRWKLVTGLRCLVIAILVIALADPQWVRTTDDQTVVFALDQSDSVPEQQHQFVADYVKAAARGMRHGKDLVAGLLFAERPAIWQLPGTQVEFDRLPPIADRHQTNIAWALKVALGMFPVHTAKRVVLISDGNENSEVSSEVARTYAALGIPIDVLPLRYEHTAEVLVERLSSPATASRDEVIELQLFVRSQRPSTAQLLLYHNDRVVDLKAGSESSATQIELNAGMNRFSIPMRLGSSGVHRFEAVIHPAEGADTLAVNNHGRTLTIVGEADRVVIVGDAQGREDVRLLAETLREGGFEAEEWSIDELPTDPAGLADCSALILSNVSAFAMGHTVQKSIASYVRDQGGGLIVVGGDQSFSVGGYARTPLEEVLPVEADRDKLKLLSLAMVIVLDRSGSMAGEKMAMARHAAAGAVRMLGPLDKIGVIAFDIRPQWVVPIRPAADRAEIARLIATIASGGGTNMYPAMEQAYNALTGQNTNLKHIIILTDGRSVPGDFEGLAQKCRDAGISVSTIAVGPDADQQLLARIATVSQGRMYVAQSAQPLPQILVHETVLASRSGLYEKPFTPLLEVGIDDRIMVGFSQQEMPTLRGHVVTSAKPLASVPLVRPTDDGADPILAYWQVGLGKSVSFTSGHWSSWGLDWASWSGFSKLWTQAVRYAGRPWNPSELDVESSLRSGKGRVVVSAEHLPRYLQTSVNLIGQLILPDYSVKPLELRRTSAGRFETEFPARMPGTYLANLAYSLGQGNEQRSGSLRTGVVVSYSPEYAILQQDETTLFEIARITGGRVLSVEYPDMVFEPSSIRPAQVRRSIWELLVQLALPLFLLDVAVRRLAITPAEVFKKLLRWIEGLVGKPVAMESVATLTTLRQARSRVQKSTRETENRLPDVDDPPQVQRTQLKPSEHVEQSSTRRESKRSDSAPSQPSVDDPGDGHTSRLLDAKRRLREGRDPGNG